MSDNICETPAKAAKKPPGYFSFTIKKFIFTISITKVGKLRLPVYQFTVRFFLGFLPKKMHYVYEFRFTNLLMPFGIHWRKNSYKHISLFGIFQVNLY